MRASKFLFAIAALSSLVIATTTPQSDDQLVLSPMPIATETLPSLCEIFTTTVRSDLEVMTGSAQIDPSYFLLVAGIAYSVAVRREDDRVVYISTNDPIFATPEGLSLDTEFSEAKQFATGEVTMEPGWGYYIQLQSGWSAGFFVGKSGTELDPADDMPISWFFKRDRSCNREAS